MSLFTFNFHIHTNADVCELQTSLDQLIKRMDTMAETVATLQKALDDLTADVAAEKAEADARQATADAKMATLEAEVKRLTEQGTASQADLDALGVKISSARTAVQGIVPNTVPQVS